MIGEQNVDAARGDQMCQEAMKAAKVCDKDDKTFNNSKLKYHLSRKIWSNLFLDMMIYLKHQ